MVIITTNKHLVGEQTSLLIKALSVHMQPGLVPLIAARQKRTGYGGTPIVYSMHAHQNVNSYRLSS